MYMVTKAEVHGPNTNPHSHTATTQCVTVTLRMHYELSPLQSLPLSNRTINYPCKINVEICIWRFVVIHRRHWSSVYCFSHYWLKIKFAYFIFLHIAPSRVNKSFIISISMETGFDKNNPRCENLRKCSWHMNRDKSSISYHQ